VLLSDLSRPAHKERKKGEKGKNVIPVRRDIHPLSLRRSSAGSGAVRWCWEYEVLQLCKQSPRSAPPPSSEIKLIPARKILLEQDGDITFSGHLLSRCGRGEGAL